MCLTRRNSGHPLRGADELVIRATMKTLLVCLLTCFLMGCNATTQRQPTVLTSPDQLDDHVGEIVTIRGEVSNTKIPMIIGVDVHSYNPDLRGQRAKATGVLRRYVVTAEQVTNANYANRGPGVFYRLKDVDSDYVAPVRPVSP